MAISSCAKITIKDIPIYWDAGPDGAVVTKFLSEETMTVSKKDWDGMRQGMACLTQEDFGWFRGTLEKACSEAKGLCTLQTKIQMERFFARADSAARRARR